MIYGGIAFQNLPIDAYPDLSPPHVEIITQWPGHAAEEVERLVTIPIEIEMNGIPQLDSLRSISLYGLSSVQMNFDYGADPYFAREQAFERVANADPAGRPAAFAFTPLQPQRPDLPLRFAEPGPLAAGTEDPGGLGRGAALPIHSRRSRRLRLGRHHHAIPGAAGPKQAVLLRHQRAAGDAATRRTTTPTPAAASTRRAVNSTTFADWDWCAIPRISANIVLRQKGGIPVYVKRRRRKWRSGMRRGLASSAT